MKIYKKMSILLAFSILFLSACGSSNSDVSGTNETTAETATVKDEAEATPTIDEGKNLYGEKTLDEIKDDLNSNGFIEERIGTDDDYKVEEVALIKRNTKEESDEVWCTLTVVGSTVKYIQDYKLTYNHYTTGGWILDEKEATGELRSLPLAGVDDGLVRYDFENALELDYDYEIKEHKTDLETMTDVVEITVSLDHYLVKVSGTLYYTYAYNGNSWELVNVERSDDYTEDLSNVWGTWVCDEREGDNYSGHFEAVTLWAGADGIYGNYYRFNYSVDGQIFDVLIADENVPMTLDFKNGQILVDNRLGYCNLNYDSPVSWDNYGGLPFKWISDRRFTEDELRVIIYN